MNNRFSMTTMMVLLFIALAGIGVGYGLWSKTLFISGTVGTGSVDALFVEAFTDDDDGVNDPAKDSQDTGDCEIWVGDAADQGSCDPAASGRDPKAHYTKDVAACIAAITGDPTVATVTQSNVYPSYFCTAWFEVLNAGSVPVKVASVTINGKPVNPSATTPFDLTGDGKADLEIHVSEIGICQQIDPRELVQMDLDQHVLQPAPQGATFGYGVRIQLNQWNEARCRVLLYFGNAGFPPSSGESLTSLKAFYESMGYGVDYTDVWPADLDPYKLVLLYGPGARNDGGGAFFSAAQVSDMASYMGSGGRVVVMGDHSGAFGVNTVNNLLGQLGAGIHQNADRALPDSDACQPLSDISPDQVTTPALLNDGSARLDPAAVSSLSLSGAAVSLARIDPAPYSCGSGVLNGATWVAIDRSFGTGGLVVITDVNILDNHFGFGDPGGDGFSGPLLAANLVGY